MSAATSAPLRIWYFGDGKPGHENQSAGLIQALSELTSVESLRLDAMPPARSLSRWLLRRCPEAEPTLLPQLTLGAGHATHVSLLATRRACGARAVVLMNPSLPLSWFDLAVIPAHDRPTRAGNVLVTEGVLNRVRPSATQQADKGLVLIGGPSAHYGWDERALYEQLDELIRRTPDTHWTLATSRRTPAGCLQALAGLQSTHAVLVPHTQTDAQWLPRQLTRAAQVWVSEDSVSMLYEALTAGAKVGLLPVPRKGAPGRVARGVEQLLADARVSSFADWRSGRPLAAAQQPFDEAARCARWILQQWFPERLP